MVKARSSQHTASPSIRQDRTLRWFTASTTSGQMRDRRLQGSRGSRPAAAVSLRKATMIASSLDDSTVECGVFGPIGASLTKARLRHLAIVLWSSHSAPLKFLERSLRSLYRSSDGVRGRSTAVKYLAHNPSRNAGSAWLIPLRCLDQTPSVTYGKTFADRGSCP